MKNFDLFYVYIISEDMTPRPITKVTPINNLSHV